MTKTNTEFVSDLMDFAKSGPIMQVFVIDALLQVSNMVADLDPDALQKQWGNLFVSAHAWVAAAREVREALNVRIAG